VFEQKPKNIPKNILVIKHGALGDMIFAQGAFQAIRDHHRSDHLVLLTTSHYAGLSKAMDLFDDVWVDDRPRLLRQPLQCFLLFKKLLSGHFDYVYDLQKSKRTRLYFKIMRLFFRPLPKWCGKFPGCHFAYTDPEQKNLHIYDRHAKLLEIAGIKNVPLPSVQWMTSDIRRFHLPKNFFLFVPGCSPTQLHKRWAPENYGHVAQFLISKNITPVIIGRSDESEAIETIQKMCPQAISLMNQTTLFDLGPLGRAALGALGHDTGPMHIIAVTGCPSILLFSYSSIPEHYAPRGFNAQVIHKNNLKDISVDEVIKRIDKNI
jgi:ADP-heptose:LPS heptosyltransferase